MRRSVAFNLFLSWGEKQASCKFNVHFPKKFQRTPTLVLFWAGEPWKKPDLSVRMERNISLCYPASLIDRRGRKRSHNNGVLRLSQTHIQTSLLAHTFWATAQTEWMEFLKTSTLGGRGICRIQAHIFSFAKQRLGVWTLQNLFYW